jgi:hypothetical protein
MRCIRISVFFAMVLCSNHLTAQEDACSDVLRIGLRDSFSKVSAVTLKQFVKTWACTEEFREATTSHSAGFGIVIPDLGPIGANYSDAVSEWQKRHCQSGQLDIDFTDYEPLAASYLSPIATDAISAWRDCIATRHPSSNGFSARISDYNPQDQKFKLDVAYNKVLPSQGTPTVDGAAVFDNAN